MSRSRCERKGTLGPTLNRGGARVGGRRGRFGSQGERGGTYQRGRGRGEKEGERVENEAAAVVYRTHNPTIHSHTLQRPSLRH